ncbi:tetratricopeptide repeat protein [Streptomyces sp. NPDC050504]|uniref:tetratricopeptide repeat protein n=1 Tax=Streptomyces sp. NPDC050504 TaxID=3365618 RepID=UPI0037879134
MTMTFDALREALRENHARPEGPARNARAELLLAEAERIREPLALVEALGHQVQVYNYSSEKDKMLVPFARLLRIWDERPGDFDAHEAHSLHWIFKWVSSGMLDQPHIPLASIEKWLGEMEHRYRIAGHSERAVRQSEFRVARHVGDRTRAERAFAAWLAADRDRMSDCHACELHGQGSWHRELGDDERALETWQPVLAGEHTCAHEPHAVLASSLLPLVRLGRTGEARANHLRGYRMVREMESMRSSVARHVEFCALTGNEPRALEILADRPSYFTDSGDPDSLLDFLAVTALLMDRLTAIGHGEQDVPGPADGRWTARALAGHARERALALAGRFDARNGTDAVSTAVRTQLDRRPLAERLPLGVRAARLAPATASGTPVREDAAPRDSAVPVPETPGAGAPDLAGLLAEARRLSAAQHPDAGRTWAAAADEAERSGTELSVRDRAEIEDHRAMAGATEPARSVALFASAAALYEEAGDLGEAAAARARGAYALALDGRYEEALAAVEEPCARALALHAAGGATTRQASGALLCRVRILAERFGESDEAVAEVGRAAREVLALAEPRRDEERVAARVAEAYTALGDVAAYGEDVTGAVELYARSAEVYEAAGLPWFAVEPWMRLAGAARHLGDLDTALRAARSALEHGAGRAGARGRARLHLQVAELLAGAGEFAEASEHALEGAHWADEAGESAGLGAYARHQLGGHLLRLGRSAEAAAVLEAVLPDLTVEGHGDGTVVQTLWWLGDALTALGEPRAAAEHWLRGAELASAWPEQRDHAVLANLAGEALFRAELHAQAERAYERAGELWRSLGDVRAVVRTLRVRAWIALREERAADAVAFMASAARECEVMLAPSDGGAGGAAAEWLAELADTHRQSAELVAESGDRETALGYAERAVAGYGAAGADFLDPRTGAELMAAWLEAELGRGAAAAARARRVREVYSGRTDEGARERVAEAESILEHAEGQE